METPTTISIKTPAGTLTATIHPNNEYPCITIDLDGNAVATVEHNQTEIQTVIYDKENDDPAAIVDFETGTAQVFRG